jgi:hypothetical protein
LGLFKKKGLAFEKIKLSKSKISSDTTTEITVNVKNFNEKFENLVLMTKTDDVDNQYLKIDKSIIQLPSLDFPNRNTGDHEITIMPYNITLNKMPFKITVQVFTNNENKPVIEKEFDLIINKKQN